MMLAASPSPPLHHPTLLLSPSHSWSTPAERDGARGGASSDLRECSNEMTSSMDEHVGFVGGEGERERERE